MRDVLVAKGYDDVPGVPGGHDYSGGGDGRRRLIALLG